MLSRIELLYAFRILCLLQHDLNASVSAATTDQWTYAISDWHALKYTCCLQLQQSTGKES